MPEKEFHFPLMFIPLGIAAILGYEWLKPKVLRYEERVNAESFAPLYLEHKAKAAKGNAESRQFIEAANRRLKKHRDDALLGDAQARMFLQALAKRGVLESDYK